MPLKRGNRYERRFIKGVVVPILTIVDEDEKIDEEKQRAQVDYVIAGGVTGILAFGFNGEFYMLEEDEMEHGLRIIVDRTAGRVPVYFGIGPSTPKSAAAWPKWPWQTARRRSACCSPCS